ncbi:UNVERIFIED_CONTAM: putative protein phosphatase 2C 40 [Sesamum angustifolium]|uniref:PPM-type phosphatase domain-containing protein n=1 Tax=Sesamum angustifolium TaxID=2727405 RepID=A0AAW2NY69_9LAMI
MMHGETLNDSEGEIKGNSSFSCLSGAALSANATLANTNICNGLFGSEILPTLDSPTSFRRIPSSPKLDFLSSSLQSSMSNLSFSPSSASEGLDYDSFSLKSMSAPSRSESFLNTMEVQIAGGAAGEDRVQAVCSEENGWVFCAIYDGFNGRDAADFLAGTLYETITFHLNLLDWDLEQESVKASDCPQSVRNNVSLSCFDDTLNNGNGDRSFKQRVLNSLQHALSLAETEFLHMVEQEMDDRPDLVSIGSCVLLVLLHGKNLYVLNVGDSRAVLATYESKGLRAVQLTDSHTVDNEVERIQLLNDHPDDPSTIVAGKVKGKLKVTRAFGVGYLKKNQLTFFIMSDGSTFVLQKSMNDALMGILRVRNLISPPYVSLQPSASVHEISNSDHFVVLGSDGLFDFFSNDEVVKLVHSYISRNPFGDPAKFLVEQLAARAAESAGFSMEELMSIPAGRRRKYHDDVTVIVIVLGTNKRASKASTCL